MAEKSKFYVDSLFDWEKEGKLSGWWCHLWTDGTDADLDNFANGIGLRLAWAQTSHGVFIPRFYHYDLRPSMRARALIAGAVVMELPDYIRFHYLNGQ